MTDRQNDVLVMIAQLYVQFGHSHHALLLLHPVLKTDPDHIFALRAAAQAQLDLGETDQAISTCQSLLSKERDATAQKHIQLMLSRAFMRNNCIDKARQAFAAAKDTDERPDRCKP
ncbi:tetratricopeptide repeat protein [Parasulfitobacter algicola]|uniref:Tetratricopeptide repeat protein n=1 Tax=Parasulfitobacter algicola TaxID=2614809 RepID=A0ABX2IV36_9RHOB|nr:tetratricopeptide repeat protein [Sulfitobacter algicola]NSX56772.1 tetratricopeptide repeat protein [Sulfitobacter algicola]